MRIRPVRTWLLVALVAVAGQAPAQERTGASEPDIENGRLIAVGGGPGGAETACFRCHGASGTGDSTGAFPRIAGQPAFYLYKQMADYASGARPHEIMSPIAEQLSQSDMEDVAAYYASMTDEPYAPRPNVDDQELLQQGAALNATGSAERGIQACQNCHGPAGIGVAPSFPYLAGQYASYIELQLERWKQGERQNDPLDIMGQIARRMSEEDIRAVALYFETVRPMDAELLRSGEDAAERR